MGEQVASPVFQGQADPDLSPAPRMFLPQAVHPSTRFGRNVRLGHGVIIDAGVRISDDVFIGHHTVIRSGVRIHHAAVIGHLVVIEAETVIGAETTIQSQCHITKGARIGSRVFFGPGAVMINEWRIASHGRRIPQRLEGPVVRNGARIGAGALIMPGVEIGQNAMIGARSIVTRNVPPREVWFGCEAASRGPVPEEEIV
jgi:UDP-2-acetamido-3-amino-2,3-dideoxy-glucuronate N-acetyltransferase